MMNRNLYANIQVAIGSISIVVGLLLVVAPGTELFSGYESTIAEAFWSSTSLPDEALLLSHWLLATCGAGVVGWGIAWVAISHIPLRSGEKWAWLTLLFSLIAWVAIDVAVAIWFGVLGELAFALIALVLAVAPLIYSKNLYLLSGN